MGLADQIFQQMNTIGEPLKSKSTTTITPGQQPYDISQIGMLLMLMSMMNQGPGGMDEALMPTGMPMGGFQGGGISPANLMGAAPSALSSGAPPLGIGGGAPGGMDLSNIFKLLATALG